ncbi:hypothetical protein BSL78_16393 [Apostichopus japonicus]|uniref:EGF-like domain-containing protein n=1 Tax=Stichopus japonicus TaxID=307972 RepID=A0A2G8KFJ6_STIJA|nr:hypothetical protein BSL78_16393 [Apostichopus japonicus]
MSFSQNRCLQNPCYPGVTCIDPGRPEPIHCGECPSPLIGDGFDCLDLDECSNPSVCSQICINELGSFSCQCRPGYELLPDGRGCQDINECDKSLCRSNSDCQNTDGNYTCSCRPGFRLLQGSSQCADINECRISNLCGENEICIDDVGGYHCSCLQGFIRHEGVCQDLDECLSPLLSDCHEEAMCINEIGSYRCKCKDGFEGNGEYCRDRNECAISPFFCHPRFVCVNDRGGYSCTCPDGFAGNGDDCYDIDECALGTHTCSDHMTCHNRVSSYTCQCEEGYIADVDGVCQNANECQQQESVCPPNSRCIDTEGSYDCECQPLYFKHEGECLFFITHCSSSPSCQEQICGTTAAHALTGSTLTKTARNVSMKMSVVKMWIFAMIMLIVRTFQVVIDVPAEKDMLKLLKVVKMTSIVGMTMHAAKRPLAWIQRERTHVTVRTVTKETEDFALDDENKSIYLIQTEKDKKDCQEDDVCSVNFICQEEEPGFSCDCPDGFQVIEGACTDINECDLDPCLDEATCHNTEGSFHCQCPGGFQGDGRPSASGCQDIDECQTRTARCPAKSDCVNEEGSYVCICQLGYELIGELCVDIDECKDSRLHDCALNSSCVNIPGTFTCQCNPGFFSYISLGQNGICEDIDECALGVQDCSLNAECKDVAGSFICTCKEGFHGDGKTCQDVDECATSRPCSQQTLRSCMNRIGSYRCICQIGYYENSQGICSESNTIELSVEFSDIKGLKTRYFYDLITEDSLDRLSNDVTVLFANSDASDHVHDVSVLSMTRSATDSAVVIIRVDFDLRANMTIQTATGMFGELLQGRRNNIVPPDSIVIKYDVYYAEENPCLSGDHGCFEAGYSHCLPVRGGGYECSDCQAGFRNDNGACVPDPCQNGESDCTDRYFASCVYAEQGQFTCEDCLQGFIQEETSCVPDPCQAGQRMCERLNFVRCIPDGNNQYHCQTCKTGFRLENGACVSEIRNNPCASGANNCQANNFQTCVFDDEGLFHCEDCLPGYRQEGNECTTDPCQLHQDNCNERNFDRCLFTTGGDLLAACVRQVITSKEQSVSEMVS